VGVRCRVLQSGPQRRLRACRGHDGDLAKAGATFEQVVRTRIFVVDISDWQAVGAAHGEVFAGIRPVSTMVEVSRLIDPAHLVEIEVDAYSPIGG
jgi:enamine deaminase RidA (YjgF/YER057c/UK114 family)